MNFQFKIRARDYLRQHTLEWRTDVLPGVSDADVCNMAEEDGWYLTCLGDIRRERFAALCRTEPAS